MLARESKSPTGTLRPLIASRRFFLFAVGLFLLESLWIALSSRYPMAFDEDFHLGIIRIYAHHLSPFLAGQPPGADAFGAVARDPSYLYQYLMSFPYRLIGVFTTDQTIQVLLLRIINVGLFAGGLVLWRRLLLKAGASKAMVNLVLFLFILIPVVPLLAAQINYDNLLFPLTALALLWTARLATAPKARNAVDVRVLLELAIICVFTSLVKYAFLPIFAAIVIYLAVVFVKAYGGWRPVWSALVSGAGQLSRASGLALAGLLLIGCLLFGQRYGVNLVRYHVPVPACDQVLSEQECDAYGPWARDHTDEDEKTGPTHDPLIFTADWFYGMWLRMFFALGGPGVNFQTRGPLFIPGMAAIALTGTGALAITVYGRRVFGAYDAKVLWLFTAAAAFYISALWFDEFRSYVQTGQAVAINGRYLFPVLLPVMLIGGLSIAEFCNGRRAWLKPAIGGAAVLCMLWGGGALTYILRSNDAWYWPSSTVRSANHAVKDVLGPVTPGYRNPVQFL